MAEKEPEGQASLQMCQAGWQGSRFHKGRFPGAAPCRRSPPLFRVWPAEAQIPRRCSVLDPASGLGANLFQAGVNRALRHGVGAEGGYGSCPPGAASPSPGSLFARLVHLLLHRLSLWLHQPPWQERLWKGGSCPEEMPKGLPDPGGWGDGHRWSRALPWRSQQV